ncbi:DMT family transporter [Leucothrix mucor]|uniref:DMT family transporter n=1 Tax=Leucothrix mucor TaxID=45248 RepID=UPI0003B5C702|nr:DMT family transporter [Leucothrix mucor]
MSLTITLLVLLAALLHASWNFLVKQADDKLLSMSAVVMGHVPFAVIALFIVPLPTWETWPYLLASTAFHTGYQWFLLNAYRFGDLSQVYPLARGVAPLLVTLISVMVLGVVLSGMQFAAIALIGLGIISLVMVRAVNTGIDIKSISLALITGCFISGYSITDGLGARVAGTAVGYYAFGSLVNATVWFIYIRLKSPGLMTRLITQHAGLSLMGGGASFSAYSLVVWAFTMAPIALVTAVRETSIIFAMLLGTLLLKERLGWQKVFAVVMTVLGVLVLRIKQS